MGRKSRIKALRKQLKEQLNKRIIDIKKDYKTHELSKEVLAPTLDTNEEGQYKIVGFEKRTVTKEVVENVNGAHKFYKVMKKMLDNPNYEPNLTPLPSKAEEENLLNEILEEDKNGKCNTKPKQQLSEEELRATTSSGLQSETSGVQHQAEQSGNGDER